MGFADVSSSSLDRARMALTGAVAGLAFWVLADVLPDAVHDDRLVMFLAALIGAFFSAMLAASGPLSAGRAVLVGLVVSVVPSFFLLWASFRFEHIDDFLETAHPLVAFVIIAAIPVPFLIAGLGPLRNWRDYPELFNQSWNVVVRYVSAWLFTAVFWGVVMLSNALFGIIGLQIIENLLDIEPVPYLVTGFVLGLALAVVNELSDYVSPYLVLRLLRLLLPVVLLVVLVFVVMVPLRGLSDLFGSLSPAGILMAMAIAGVTLVSTAIDRSDDEAVTMPFMLIVTRVLALALPVLAGLAAYAVGMRVYQYGWSPDRLAAATVAGIVLSYALFYLLAVVRRRGWMSDIRRFNTWMALALIAVAVFWLTPAVNPQRISANDQLARYQAGRTAPDDLDLWTISRDWGRAGQLVAPQFAQVEGVGQALVKEQLAALEKADDFRAYQRLLGGPESYRMTEFLSRVPVRPEGAEVPADVFGNAGRPSVWIDACARKTDAGNPGCVMVLADFLPKAPGDEVLLVTNQAGDWLRLEMWSHEATGLWRSHGTPVRLSGPEAIMHSDEIIDRIVAGEFLLRPVSVNTIGFGDTRLIMLP